MSNIGILGGTFDPIHNGHLMLAKETHLQFDLDEILVMVSKTPPHKNKDDVTITEFPFERIAPHQSWPNDRCSFPRHEANGMVLRINSYCFSL